MTTVIEIPNRLNNITKRIIDSQEEFNIKIKNSQIITYSIEYFANCFLDEPKHLKAVHIRLYNFKENQRPEINQYLISWEDIPQTDEETWNNFRFKVDKQLKDFLNEITTYSRALEETSA